MPPKTWPHTIAVAVVDVVAVVAVVVVVPVVVIVVVRTNRSCFRRICRKINQQTMVNKPDVGQIPFFNVQFASFSMKLLSSSVKLVSCSIK